MCTVRDPDVRTEARFDTGLDLEPIVRSHQAELALAHRENAERSKPDPVCTRCGWPTQPGDMDWLFHSEVCSSCAMDLVDKLLYKAARKHGRRKALKLLKRLAK